MGLNDTKRAGYILPYLSKEGLTLRRYHSLKVRDKLPKCSHTFVPILTFDN